MVVKTNSNLRILTIDDSPAIQDDYAKILAPQAHDKEKLYALAENILGQDSVPTAKNSIPFVHVSANSGLSGIEAVEESVKKGRPFSVAFVDIRMPPGIDGLETTKRIWEIDSRINVVLCTAYADYSWNDIHEMLGNSDRLLVLKKPFDKLEVVQMANSLSSKWDAMESLKKKNSALDRLHAEQRSYAEKLARSIETRNTFFARISHDLRLSLIHI